MENYCQPKNGSKPEDVMFMGSSQPVWTGGLFNTVRIQGPSAGNQYQLQYWGDMLFRDVNYILVGAAVFQQSSWLNLPTDGKYPEMRKRPIFQGMHIIVASPTKGIPPIILWPIPTSFEASYAKIREITLSYALPQKPGPPYRCRRVDISAPRFSNLMLWKANEHGIDPEFHFPSGGRSIRTGQEPITIGAHLTL